MLRREVPGGETRKSDKIRHVDVYNVLPYLSMTVNVALDLLLCCFLFRARSIGICRVEQFGAFGIGTVAGELTSSSTVALSCPSFLIRRPAHSLPPSIFLSIALSLDVSLSLSLSLSPFLSPPRVRVHT